MNNVIKMLMQQKFNQIPHGMMKQLEQQLKRLNPQEYQNFQKAKENNENPNEYLNRVIGGFNDQQRQGWDNMMGMFNQIQK